MSFENINIFIYCGGKCGSSTLEQTFRKYNYNVIRLHYNKEFKLTHKTNRDVYDVLCENSKKNKIYIIDSYRTPLERKISSFFENIKTDLPNYDKLTIEELINVFNTKFLNNIEEYHSINEIMNHNKIPLFDSFNFTDKYIKIEKDNIVYIKLRFSDISEWNNILSSIFQKKIEVHSANLTKNKAIYDLSEKFKKSYKVPKAYINSILNNREFNVFNSEQEKISYKSYWMQKSF